MLFRSNKRFAMHYIEVNVGDLERFEEGAVIDGAVLKQSGVISLPKVNDGVKVLGNGDLTRKLTVRATAFTAAARKKIEEAGGSAEEV